MWEITRIAMRRPVTTVMVFVSMFVVGVIASRLLPLEFFPEVEFPGLFIQAPYQGSSPEEVERLITRPIEEVVATMGSIERMQSTSRRDSAQVFVFFGWDSDVGVKSVEVRDKLDAIKNELPDDLRRINVFKFVTSDAPILQLRLSANRDLEGAYDLLNRNLKRRLERLEGVSQVDLGGVEPPEIRIELDADRVAAYNVNLNDLSAQLAADNFSVTAGKITSNGRRLLVHPIGEYRSLDDIRNVIVSRGVRLSDIADVIMTEREKDYSRHLDGTYAVSLEIRKASGANMVAVTERVMNEIEEISKLPQMEGITIFTMGNQAEGVTSSLKDLVNAGLIGALFSLIVLFLFLRQLSVTLMVTLAVPFSLTIALAAMYFLDVSLNILSLMGLMLAVGMLVDNAVVVSESIFRYKQKMPGDPMGATLEGTKEVATAVFAGTLTTIIVFLPVVFGEASNITIFLGHVAVTIIFSLIGSLALALTMIPMIAARIDVPAPDETTSRMERLKKRYRNMLDWTLVHRWASALIIALIVAVSMVPMGQVKKDMFPEEESRQLNINIEVNGTYSLEVVEENITRVEEYLFANKERYEIDSVYSWMQAGFARITLILTEDEEAKRSSKAIRDELIENLPQIAIGKYSFNRQRSGASEGLAIYLRGESSETLMELSEDFRRAMQGIEGITEVSLDTEGTSREIQVVVDRAKAQRLGLDSRAVATTISTAMRGQNLRQFRGGQGEIDIRLEFSEDDRQSLAELYSLPIYNAAGEEVLLSSIASIRLVDGPAEIRRSNRATNLKIDVGLAKDVTMFDIRPKLQRQLSALSLPEGYQWSFGRAFDEAQQTENQMATNFLLALMLIFIVMAALFEKLLQPLAIISGIFFSVLGIFWLFWLSGTIFDLMAMIGILILMGVVVNNGIVMLDHINNLRKEGMERREAILQGATDRLRPILMTVATTVLGLIPLAVGNTQLGGDGPPYFPMARAIIGGLLFSTIVSLAMLPTIYAMLDDLGQWSARALNKARVTTLRRLTAIAQAGTGNG
ncbi:MAG: efflux RND transporter permease subunit [Gammaproteobacteria bacterium]|nr:efflux RND transporter permease subunit [Gammaproteobacteria bacterium]